jgi:hypothetical protein
MRMRTVLAAALLSLGTVSVGEARSHMLTFSCNVDGTYTCGSACDYRGGCCRMSGLS